MTKRPPRIKRAPHDKENPYYMASRATAQDKNISYEALGLLNFILSKPDSWEIQPAGLVRAGCKRNRVYRLLNELIEHKYIERVYNRDAKGKVRSVDYVAHETPYEEQPLPTNPLPEKQEMDNQEVEKQEVENPDVDIADIIYNREEKNTDNTSTPKVAEVAAVEKPKRYSRTEPWRNALLACWNLTPATVTRTADRTYWTAAADFAKINFPVERIPEFHRWCKSQNWTTFTVMAMARHAGEWLAAHTKAQKVIPLDPAQDLSILVPFDAPLDRFLKEQEDAS